MDAFFFLKERTGFIRFFYDTASPSFAEIRRQIKEKLPPFDDPPYSEDPEPAFLEEWTDTTTAEQILGLVCVSLLSDTLKLYFHTLQKRVIGFAFTEQETRRLKKEGFVAAYLSALGEILETDWSECPADLAVVEQIVLARNRSQHGGDLTSFDVSHDGNTLDKHPRPFFASADELENWPREVGSLSAFLMPSIEITREKLFVAMKQVEMFAEWIETRMDKAQSWRKAQSLEP